MPRPAGTGIGFNVTGATPGANYALFSVGISGEVAPGWDGKFQLDGALGAGRKAIGATATIRHPL